MITIRLLESIEFDKGFIISFKRVIALLVATISIILCFAYIEEFLSFYFFAIICAYCIYRFLFPKIKRRKDVANA